MRLTAARLLLVGALTLAGCGSLLAPARPPSGEPLRCLPDFPYQGGWLGGDAAYSVPLSPTDTLWLFGDTFVGDEEQSDRVGATFIHNSIGISRCTGERWEIEYFWSDDAEGTPRAFLADPRVEKDQRWWWLFDGFQHDGALYIGLLEVEEAAPSLPIGIPFRSVGMRLARVENPIATPADWRTTSFLLWDSDLALPGAALVVHGDWLYLFTFLQNLDASSPRVLARLPLSALDAVQPRLPEALEYLSRDGDWKPGLDPSDARVLMDDNATEMSVVWHAERERWIALYSHPNAEGRLASEGPSSRVYVRSAPSLEGPWSEPWSIYSVPELMSDSERDPDTACYAAKEHAQFAVPGRSTFTYVCNLFTPPGGDGVATLRRLLHDMELYRPRAVRRPLPEGAFPPRAQ